MSGTWQQILPALMSILIIIIVTIVRAYSKTLAAITATMPVTIPLAFWIIYSGSGGDQTTVLQFTEALFITTVANMFFVAAIWLAARAGWHLAALLPVAYLVWGVVLGLIMGARRLLVR